MSKQTETKADTGCSLERMVRRWRHDAEQYQRQVDEASSKGLAHHQMLSMVTCLKACAKEVEHELRLLKAALDKSGTAVGNEHETYSLAQRIKNLTTEREYFRRQTDKARGECEQLKASAAPPNDPSSATRPTTSHDCNRSAMAGFAAAPC